MRRHLKGHVVTWVAVFAAFVTLLTQAALAVRQMAEPLFGILYNPTTVIFERAPQEISRCSDLNDPPRKLFLLGKTTARGEQFYYVYGQVKAGLDTSLPGGEEFEAESDAESLLLYHHLDVGI